MPPPRKIDLLPPELRGWLQDELRANGFGNYDAIAAGLADRMEAEGVQLNISRSAIHAYGQEYREFAKLQEEAGAWAANWMNDAGLEQEAQRHNVLFQMITSLAFKAMAGRMEQDGAAINPQELHFIGRMLKDIMASSGMREKLLEAERAAQVQKLDHAVENGDIDQIAAQKAREIMGFA